MATLIAKRHKVTSQGNKCRYVAENKKHPAASITNQGGWGEGKLCSKLMGRDMKNKSGRELTRETFVKTNLMEIEGGN